MRFQVPQFIEVEDKIFGPLTFKQFIYIAGSVGLCVILFVFVPKFLAFVIGIPVIIFGAALAFYKVNDRPFTQVIEDFLHYSLGGKLYVWKKEERKPEARTASAASAQPTQVYVPKLSESKLKDLATALDVANPEANETPARSLEETFKV